MSSCTRRGKQLLFSLTLEEIDASVQDLQQSVAMAAVSTEAGHTTNIKSDRTPCLDQSTAAISRGRAKNSGTDQSNAADHVCPNVERFGRVHG
jgi:hypothetical protein